MILTVTAVILLGAAPPPSKALLDKGKASFATNCAACHGEKGHGDGPAAVALNPKPRNYAVDPFKQGDKPDDIFKTLQTGVPNTAMVSFAHLSEEERWSLVYWVLELKKSGAPADAGKPVPAPTPKK